MAVARYTQTAMVLHWIVAALIATNVVLALTWDFYPDAAVRPAIDTHKSIGITVLGLAILRLLWRLTHRPPTLPDHHKTWEKRSAHGVHIALYVLIFAIPLTGWIMDSAWKDAAKNPMQWFYLFEWPRIGAIMTLDPATKEWVHDVFGETHEIAGFILYALVFAHIAGALKHQWIDKDRELARMGMGKA